MLWCLFFFRFNGKIYVIVLKANDQYILPGCFRVLFQNPIMTITHAMCNLLGLDKSQLNEMKLTNIQGHWINIEANMEKIYLCSIRNHNMLYNLLNQASKQMRKRHCPFTLKYIELAKLPRLFSTVNLSGVIDIFNYTADTILSKYAINKVYRPSQLIYDPRLIDWTIIRIGLGTPSMCPLKDCQKAGCIVHTCSNCGAINLHITSGCDFKI